MVFYADKPETFFSTPLILTIHLFNYFSKIKQIFAYFANQKSQTKMRHLVFLIILLLFSSVTCKKSNLVNIEEKEDGWRLFVNGEAYMINGMNWDYFPVGTNYTYVLWDEPEAFIRQALDYEMSLLRDMGVNAIRIYTGIPPKWIQYIYETYGIYTMLNHSFGRYGLTLGGEWVGNTEYSDPEAQDLLLAEVKQLAEQFKNTPGLLLYLLGNENNYGLFWGGAETEDIPVADRKSTQRARHLYKLFNEAALAMKAIDPGRPIAICNGDLMFLGMIAEECQDVDILGINVYRGISFTDLFDRVNNEYGKPVLLTEFGSDALNAITMEEAQREQAMYKVANWREIYENAAGLGKAGNSIGGFTFQFSDGWWKHGQTFNLDVHDTHASWSNGGYSFDYVAGENNMNEEWFGICAKGPTDEMGFYRLYPRAAYYALKEAHQLKPYAEGTTLKTIKQYFDEIDIEEAFLKARD